MNERSASSACADSQSCHAGHCQWDLVAACYSTGQVVGLQSGSEQRGPLQPLGSGPVSSSVSSAGAFVSFSVARFT